MKVRFFILALSILLSACASTPPNTLSSLPVVRYQDALKTQPQTPYILYFPAREKITMISRLSGSMLVAPDEKTLHAMIAKDIYVHEEWMSFDLKTWMRYDKLLGFNVQLELPSTKKPQNGKLELELIDKTHGTK